MGVPSRKRLFLDGMMALEQTATYPERLSRALASLSNELRARDVTAVMSAETRMLFAPTVEVPVREISSVIENIILLRYVELRSKLYRLISIMKLRESAHDPAIREFRITDDGIIVASTFDSAEAILTGVGRPTPSAGGPSDTRARRKQGQ